MITAPGPAPEFCCCAHRTLPPELALPAAWHAAVERPANAPGLVELAYTHPVGEPLPPQAIAFLRGKFWANGSTLKVAFRGGTPAVNAKVLAYASLWSKWANVDFLDVGPSDSWDILVGYDQEGYWSLVGTDARMMRGRGEQTLNLQGFDRYPMPDGEWSRVVCHEIGHALGALHEMMRPEIQARLNRPAVLEWARRTQGWDTVTTDAQFFQVINMDDTVSSQQAEEASIMEYTIGAELTIDHTPILGGTRITEMDGRTIALVYPGRGPVHPQLRSFAEAL